MNPLSIRRRRIYLILSVIVFFVTIPLLILYATGYRLGNALNLVRTGGLSISVPYSGAEVRIGNLPAKQTSLFQKNIFVQNLRPSTYDISVTKEGSQPWKKKLLVSPQTVTEAHAFLLPNEPVLEAVTEFLPGDSAEASTTKVALSKLKPNPVYVSAQLLFGTSTQNTATTSDALRTKRKLAITNENGVLHVEWKGNLDSLPYYFCSDQTCKNEVIVRAGSKILSFDFFPGRDDLLVVALSDGIFVIDIDDRSDHNIQRLFVAPNLELRVQNDETIFIKQEKNLFRVSL